MDLFHIGLSILTLTILEIILGIDNLVFLAILTEKLPKKDRQKARYWGLSFAWVTRLMLLASAIWIVHLSNPLVTISDFDFSIRDLFLLAGGVFLIMKATQEISYELVEKQIQTKKTPSVANALRMVVLQVAVMDIIFSLDSVLTAIGLTDIFWVMAVAITIAILVMIYSSDTVGVFIEKNPTIKMLALCFLILIGTMLIADGFHFHIPRGYLYFSMIFALSIETLNMLKRRRKKRKIS
ncbi:MAG: TerC family protein [Legionellaceae bacterium]|nr:TerC family protein [Legionellaceae bacterium]